MRPDRRKFLQTAAATGALLATGIPETIAAPDIHLRAIPTTGEQLPVIGMGTWITFNVGSDLRLRDARTEVLRTFLDNGGRFIDSSPMYGAAEDVLGYALKRLGTSVVKPFAATKVWTRRKSNGPRQMAKSERLWGVQRFDLMQVHNLVEWRGHLETLADWKRQGRVRHLGITTSHGGRHEEMQAVMSDPDIVPMLDTVQFTYNIVDRAAEARLLPLAAERGLGVIVNRPFQRGGLIDLFAGKPLPAWAEEIEAATWPQFLLKFIVSHPAVTCAIPATSRVDHMIENLAVLRGPLPDAAMRRRMADYVRAL